MAHELEDGLAGLDILRRDLLLFFTSRDVGSNMLQRSEFGDLANALGIENIVGIQACQWCLLEEVDRGIFEHVSVQVGTDDFDDLVAKAATLGVQVDEVEALAYGLERFGELGDEQLFECVLAARSIDTDRLCDLDDIFLGLIDPNEEQHLDIGADVVLADQALGCATVDLDSLDRRIHDLGLVDHRQDQPTGEGDDDLVGRAHDQRFALWHLSVQRAVEHGAQEGDAYDYKNYNNYANKDGSHGMFLSL